ncbi:MAG: magnetochrome domain-containing protein [Candidatus Omnitrophica bacterium]|nr:magnetochrome domain-containing protein [Candidatus Omnitrophota bacterium]
MKNDKKEEIFFADDSCANINAKSLWMIGLTVVGLTSFFCFALFNMRPKPVPVQDPAQQGIIATGGSQQVAFQQNYPTAAQDFNQWQSMPQQVAYIPPGCMTCPTVTQCFPQGTGAAQQAAYVPPNCAVCPNVAQCFPPATGGGQQIAFQPNCPTGTQIFNQWQAQAGQQAAYIPPGCMTCPTVTQCFPPATTGGAGQQIAYTGRNGCVFPGARTVALTKPIPGQTKAPAILRDAIMMHEFRGVCENCHVIMTPNVPAIPANAQAPHEYRGICSKCHVIQG